jgi:hypothetical protein
MEYMFYVSRNLHRFFSIETPSQLLLKWSSKHRFICTLRHCDISYILHMHRAPCILFHWNTLTFFNIILSGVLYKLKPRTFNLHTSKHFVWQSAGKTNLRISTHFVRQSAGKPMQRIFWPSNVILAYNKITL